MIALLFQIVITLIDRYWYYVRPPSRNDMAKNNKEINKEEKYTTLNYGLLGKFLTHIFLIIIIHIIVFWTIPNSANRENILHPECDYEARLKKYAEKLILTFISLDFI